MTYDIGEHIRQEENRLSCLTPEELVDTSGASSVALNSEIAYQMCNAQVLAAIELGDYESANAYMRVRPTLARYAFRST